MAKKKQMSAAERRMRAQGELEATQSDLIRAKNKAMEGQKFRPKYQFYTATGNGVYKESDAPPKDGFFRERSLRHKHVTPKRVTVKLKTEIWNQLTMSNFFRRELIHADKPNGWAIFFNEPARKMTIADQLVLMLAHTQTEYEVHINRVEKHMVIDMLEPEP